MGARPLVTVWKLANFHCELWALAELEDHVQLRLFNQGLLQKVQDTTLDIYPAQAKVWKEELLPERVSTAGE